MKYTGFESQFINGDWVKGSAQGEIKVVNPFSQETILSVSTASKQDVDIAYAGAEKAQQSWGKLLPQERAAVLKKLIQVIDARYGELHEWLVTESGSTALKAHIELGSAKNIIEESISLIGRATGSIMPSSIAGQESRAYRLPLGVVTVISPWNFPFHLSMRSVAPAIALGNSVLLKPSSDTPVTGGLLFGKLFEEAGLPKGVLSVVVGKGSEIGDYVVTHAATSFVSFTGSTPVGHRIGQLAMGNPIKRVALELGGNAPIVVLKDADVDEAMKATVFGRFLHQGQICMSTNRAIVDASIYDEYVEKLLAHVKTLKVGNPAEMETAIGPLINEKQVNEVKEKIALAEKQGATVAYAGGINGNLVGPHVFINVDPNSAIAKEESFAPLLPVIKAKDEDDAAYLANLSEFGLSSAVFTKDLERGVEFAQRIRVGMTHINDISVDDQTNAPFGGEKNSGLGRFNGEWVLNEFTRMQWITVQKTPRPYPF